MTLPPTGSTPTTDVDAPRLDYPQSRKGEGVDRYFGTSVEDPYRWLEDDSSDETQAWVTAQNQLTDAFLSRIPYRQALKQRMQQLWSFEASSSPFIEGSYRYFYKKQGLQNHHVLYRQAEGGQAEVFLDPNTFSADGTTSLEGLSFSRDGSKVAYSISEGGSDWQKVIVIDAVSGRVLEDTLQVKFSAVCWRGNEGFYYSTYPNTGPSDASAALDQHLLYFHRLGQPYSDDEVVFGLKRKRRYVSGYVTEDERFLVISASQTTYGNELYLQDLSAPGSVLVPVVDNFDSDSIVIESRDGQLFIETDLQAPNRRLVCVAARDPGPEHWKDLIAEGESVLTVTTGAGYLFAHYLTKTFCTVFQYSYGGELLREVALPGRGTLGGLSGKHDDRTLYYDFTTYTDPGAIYAYDARSGQSQVYEQTMIDFNSQDYESRQVFYRSKDGTPISMTICHRKGLPRNAQHPTLLYGYGGFNVSLAPEFSLSAAAWMENGGVYAVANLRGGGEYGMDWYEAGTLLNKQTTFDDFIAAAEYLIAERYTSPAFLAIQGASNGGLLVGATMIQRPDLFRVALPAVGVMDMLRYHRLGSGAGWADDYGTVEDSQEMFECLLRYSPLHNVRDGVAYPATLITTASNDDRVFPAHSFKFAARLQAAQANGDPILINVDTQAGHGAGRPLGAVIEEDANLQAFALYAMGIRQLPER